MLYEIYPWQPGCRNRTADVLTTFYTQMRVRYCITFWQIWSCIKMSLLTYPDSHIFHPCSAWNHQSLQNSRKMDHSLRAPTALTVHCRLHKILRCSDSHCCHSDVDTSTTPCTGYLCLHRDSKIPLPTRSQRHIY